MTAAERTAHYPYDLLGTVGSEIAIGLRVG